MWYHRFDEDTFQIREVYALEDLSSVLTQKADSNTQEIPTGIQEGAVVVYDHFAG